LDILPWEDVEREAERLLESTRANARKSENSGASQEQDDDRTVDRDESDPYNEVIFGRRRPDSVAIEWTSKTGQSGQVNLTCRRGPEKYLFFSPKRCLLKFSSTLDNFVVKFSTIISAPTVYGKLYSNASQQRIYAPSS
jgi:hypothetical protein